MSERRRYERRSCTELINISTSTRRDRAGLAHDLSPTGLGFQSASRFEIGERVDVLMEARSIGRLTMNGRIAWTSTTPQYSRVFPHSAAIEFDNPYVELAAVERAERISALDIAELI